MCQRVRETGKHVFSVGEVSHGYATGHVWECSDIENCDEAVKKKLENPKLNGVVRHKILNAREVGRYKTYVYFN